MTVRRDCGKSISPYCVTRLRVYTGNHGRHRANHRPGGTGIPDRSNNMELKINSRKLGRTITFSRPGSSYIFADLNGQPGTLGNQICRDGSTTGSTLSYSGDSQEEFERICRNWYRAYLRHELEYAI